MDDKTAVFLPYCCACSFPDGTRRRFSGLSRDQAQQSMFKYAEQYHDGEYGPWHWVTDENYINGQYYKLYPPPPVVDFTLPTYDPANGAYFKITDVSFSVPPPSGIMLNLPPFDTEEELLEYLRKLSEQEDDAE